MIGKEKMKERSRALLRDIINEKIDLPDDALVFLDPEVLLEMVTPKRLELLRLIEKKRPQSVNELASLSGRMKQAVDRDLKILERYDIIELRKEGRRAVPVLKRKIVMFSLAGNTLQDIGTAKSKVYG